MPKLAYLDHNATAPVRPEAIEAAAAAMRQGGNPSSVHGPGRATRRLVENARAQVAALVGAAPEGVVFTSGGTEANNLALRGCGRRTLLVSAIEHESVLNAAAAPVMVAVTPAGQVDLADLERRLGTVEGADTVVSIMAANNETGVIQPVLEAAEMARAHGALVHCDAVQAAGKLGLEALSDAVDMLSLSAHKIGGPPGVGALVVREGVGLAARNRDGGQERGRRAGTENIPGIVGFGVAAQLAGGEIERFAALVALRDRLETEALAAKPGAVIFGRDRPRLANTACLAIPAVRSETQIMALDLAGIAVSAGAACSSGKVSRSHVLTAMGVPPELGECAIRVSLGLGTTGEEVDRFLAAWTGLSGRIGAAA